MFGNAKLFNKNYVFFVVLLIMLVAGMLTWIASARMLAFHQFYVDIGHESLNGVDQQVSFYISEKRRIVETFVHDHIDQIRMLASNPDSDTYHDDLVEDLAEYFPDYFAFSLTNNKGIPLFQDFDGLISDLCLSDVKQYLSGEDHYHPYIHPNTEGYHFDIMVRYGAGDNEGVFFVSFLADVLSNIINSIQGPDHKIMLIQPLKEDLIEVVAEGARNKWLRNDYRLDSNEKELIYSRHDVKGTRWQAVDFHNTDLHSSYRNELIFESLLIFFLFVSIAMLLVVRLRNEEFQRLVLENQKKEIMGMVSHEFRSPAASIKSALNHVSRGAAGNIDAKAKEFIDLAADRCSHLLFLVDDFVDIQNLESGSLKFNKQKASLKDIVVDAVKQNKPYAMQFSVEYKLLEPLAADFVYCDVYRIHQVLTNFLSNAAKYGSDNDVIKITIVRKAWRLRVSITDHGSGISEEFRASLFEKFAMAYAPKKDQKIKSSGLGLNIAKAIVEQHDGTVGFETSTDEKTGTGTTFWFEIPVL